MRGVRRSVAVVVALSASWVLGACGGSSSSSSTPSGQKPARSAAGADCPVQNRTETLRVTFVNDTATAVVVQVPVDGWSCADWSGPASPGNISGLRVEAGASVTVPLDSRYGVIPHRPDVMLADPGGPSGTVTTGVGSILRDDHSSGEFPLNFRTPSINGRGTQLVALGPSPNIPLEVYKYRQMKAKVSGKSDWSRDGSVTGTAEGGRKIEFAWSGGEDELRITMKGP